jgi:uncharacterized protein
MVYLNDIKANRRKIIDIAEKYGAHNVRIFGSVLRGENTASSDIDFLVNIDDNRSLLDHIALMRSLEKMLGCKIDVVNEDVLDPLIKDRVLMECKAI